MPTAELLEATRMLSKSQFAFVATATVVNKAVTEGKPQWLVDQLHPVQASRTSKGRLEPLRTRTNLRGGVPGSKGS